MKLSLVAIAVPTFRRPESLLKALQSLATLRIPESIRCRVIVVDNDPQQSALPVIREFTNVFPCPVLYEVESTRGISSVRNRILDEAASLGADLLAGIDDDEYVDPGWLEALLMGFRLFEDTQAVFGPTISLFDQRDRVPSYIRRSDCFSPYSIHRTGDHVPVASTASYMLSIPFAVRHGLRFDDQFNFVGGGDSDFFLRVAQKGGRVVFVKDAYAYEEIPSHRANLRWVLRREFRIGYGMARIRQTYFEERRSAILVRNGIFMAKSALKLTWKLLFGKGNGGFREITRLTRGFAVLCRCCGVPPIREYHTHK